MLILLLVGAMMLGLATVDKIRLERATGDAAMLTESEGREVVGLVGGNVLCWWRGTGTGSCYDDGLVFERTQIVAVGRTWQHPAGSFTVSVRVSRPTEEVSDADE